MIGRKLKGLWNSKMKIQVDMKGVSQIWENLEVLKSETYVTDKKQVAEKCGIVGKIESTWRELEEAGRTASCSEKVRSVKK